MSTWVFQDTYKLFNSGLKLFFANLQIIGNQMSLFIEKIWPAKIEISLNFLYLNGSLTIVVKVSVLRQT